MSSKKPAITLMCMIGLLVFNGRVHAEQQKELINQPTQSMLWKVTGNGLEKPSYVFGSWHFLCRNEIVFKNKVKVAIKETEQLMFQNFVTYLGSDDYYENRKETERIDSGEPIYKIDDRKVRKRLLKLIKEHMDLKIDLAKRVMPIVKRMTPMEVFFSSMHSFIKDCSGLGSFDNLLYQHYQKINAPIGSFNERKTFLERLMASGFLQAESLMTYLEEIESKRAMVRAMKAHYYLDEDVDGLKKLYRIFLNNDLVDEKSINKYVFNIDTQPWVDMMASWIAIKPTFISVNANYLFNDGLGVIELLKQKGYEVEPVH
ncbi:TraB/GumN family protein [Marinicella litoralis]|uniref:Uncharacterized protein YbaP (TraB family) n=1 Tax=Marinicella litoralis TaxID=644220 RepID=A0A4R6XF17_9GAMM|nr:TraB/GumN family protein [Marinicella litoralis]TDR16350.1 uncharacterized protein YbaP (TraB family) [Marinicella litoralis]